MIYKAPYGKREQTFALAPLFAASDGTLTVTAVPIDKAAPRPAIMIFDRDEVLSLAAKLERSGGA